jgi:FkbM family methyltransferase
MLDKINKLFLFLQGKGYGSASLKSEVKATRKFVKGGVFVDVGANKGLYSQELLTQYENSITELHLFEPSKELTEKYLNFSDNRVRVNNFALSDLSGTATLYKVAGNAGLNSLTKRRLDHFEVAMDDVEEIKKTTLDEYTAKNNINVIDLLKIDVEGHELDVLKGAGSNLKDNRIRCIQFEFGGCNIDTRVFFQDFWYLLNGKYNFKIFRITPFGIKRLEKYTELDEIFLTTNFLAIKDPTPK